MNGYHNYSDILSSKRQSRLQMLCDEVDKTIEDELIMLKRASDVVIGMRIIQQFAVDLLGRDSPEACIFTTKTKAE